MFTNELERLVLENITVRQYYSDKIRGLDTKFHSAYDLNSERAICPLHNDTDPSFGLMKDKQNNGVVLYHCFGCGMVGNVIRLHQLIAYKYSGVSIELLDATKELAKMYGLANNIDELAKVSKSADRYVQDLRVVRESQNAYFSKDFDRDLLGLRMSDADVASKSAQLNRYIVSAIKKELEKEE